MESKSKKRNLGAMITGTIISGALLTNGGLNANELFSYDDLGSGSELRSELLDAGSNEFKTFEASCGEKKTEDESKAAEHKCGEGKCGEGKCGEEKSGGDKTAKGEKAKSKGNAKAASGGEMVAPKEKGTKSKATPAPKKNNN